MRRASTSNTCFSPVLAWIRNTSRSGPCSAPLSVKGADGSGCAVSMVSLLLGNAPGPRFVLEILGKGSYCQ